MHLRFGKSVVLSTFFASTTALISPATAQVFDNQVSTAALIAINSGNVYASGVFNALQIIPSGIGNNIGAGATGALGIASVSQTFSQSTVQQGANSQGGNSVVVGAISATNNTPVPPPIPANPAFANIEATVEILGLAIIGTPVFGSPLNVTGGGIANSIGASATGAAAVASVVQSFDTNTNIDLTSLASNRVRADAISATNQAGSVRAVVRPGNEAAIGGGIGNSITAQAGGASASASIATRMLDTTNTYGTALPPGVATNTVRTDAISAVNRGAVTAIYGTSNNSVLGSPGTTSTIFDGNGNTMGAVASGASASAGISQSTGYTTLPLPGSSIILNAVYANTVNTGALSARNGTDGTVSAVLGSSPFPVLPPLTSAPVFGATIAYGVGNAIAAQVSGAAAGGSIAQRYDNVGGVAPGGYFAPLGATNRLVTESMSAVNRGDIAAIAAIAPLPSGTASLISGGIGNMIGASAVGASTGLGITQATTGSSIFMSLGVDNTARMNGSMSARNGAGASVLATMTGYAPSQITHGVGNSIAASAVGASASATINQSILGDTSSVINATDVVSLGSNTVIVNASSGHAMSAVTNADSSVTARFDQRASIGAPQNSAAIQNGVANSISAQAAGASVNAGITARLDNIITGIANSPSPNVNRVDTTVGTVTDLFARNNGTVSASFTSAEAPGGNLAIVTGVANNIGASAVGASASASINQTVASEGPLLSGIAFPNVVPQGMFANVVRTGDIEARNNGAVSSTLTSSGGAVAIGPQTFVGPLPSSGVGNSIAAQSVGASASAGISSRFYAVIPQGVLAPGVTTPATNTVHVGDITAVSNGTPGPGNNGSVTAATTIGTPMAAANVAINTGIGNFVGASASGATAGAGITQSVSQPFGLMPFTMAYLPANSVTAGDVSATNSSMVNATLTLTNGTAQIGLPIGNPSFLVSSGNASNVGNAIAAQATGASAAASISFQNFNTAVQAAPVPSTQPTNRVQVASLSSTNTGPVIATAALTGGTVGFPSVASINGGVGNSIGASATGAASSASISQIVSTSVGPTAGTTISTLNTLPANTISAGSISAFNSGSITASLTTSGFNATAPNILGGVGNSISANAVGASAGASISQSIANVR